MNYDAVEAISEPVLNVLLLGVPAWLVFYPPRTVRARPWWYRAALAVFVAQTGIYVLFYGFVIPASHAYRGAYERAHPGSVLFMDGILMGGTHYWVVLIPYTALCLALRGIYLISALRFRLAAARCKARDV